MSKKHASVVVEKNSQPIPPLIQMKTDSFTNIFCYLTKSFGTPGLSMIYSMGHDSGAQEVKKIREEMKKLKNPLPQKQLIEKTLQRLSQTGWGRFEIEKFDQSMRNIEIKITKNPFSDNCAMNENSGCLFLNGYISGVLTEALEEEISCGFPRCMDLDESNCVFKLEKQLKA